MKAVTRPFHVLNTVTEYTRFYGLPAPAHPLLTVVDLSGLRYLPSEQARANVTVPVVQQFYVVSLKRNLGNVAVRYGHRSYDYNEGVLSFMSPGQGCWMAQELDINTMEGWTLLFHPDLLAKYPLGQKIMDYGFFAYAVNEALHLSEQEETILNGLLDTIRAESERPVDAFSQDLIVAQLEVLMTYANRFYHRQFLTRRMAEPDRSEGSLLTRFEHQLNAYFSEETGFSLPTVQSFADALNVSPAYLSDMLRSLTGQNTQQHIHQSLIEKAKGLLLTTSLSVNETAYQLGFEYPQYFSRLFKKKTGQTPAEFRLSMQ